MGTGAETIGGRKSGMKGKGGEDPGGPRPAEQGGSMTETPLDTSSAGLLVNGWDAAFCPDPVPTEINGRRMAYGGFYLRGSSAFRTLPHPQRKRPAAPPLRALPPSGAPPPSHNP